MDAAEFQLEVKRIEKLLFRIAWAYLGNNQDVEDAVQDSLVKAWEKQGMLRNQDQFKAWITRILVNQCKNLLRKRKKWSFYPLEEKTVQTELDGKDAPVLEAMNKLKPEQRVIVTLFYLDGYSQRDVAEILQCPVGTVKTRLHAAKNQLKKVLLIEWEEDI